MMFESKVIVEIGKNGGGSSCPSTRCHSALASPSVCF